MPSYAPTKPKPVLRTAAEKRRYAKRHAPEPLNLDWLVRAAAIRGALPLIPPEACIGGVEHLREAGQLLLLIAHAKTNRAAAQLMAQVQRSVQIALGLIRPKDLL